MSTARPLRFVLAMSLVAGLLGLAAGPASAAGRVIHQPNAIEGRYIVVFSPSASLRPSRVATDVVRVYGGSVRQVYRWALKGFVADMTPEQALEASRDPRVVYVEEDSVVRLDAVQTPATWGLDRIDQRNLPLDDSYTYTQTGNGVTAYVIDTGIRFTHQEFGGRAVSGTDLVDGGTADDCNGHGTHVAGTIGGATYGVAKEVNLVAVRVLSCRGFGSNSQVIGGIDWVTADHDPGEAAVANMSLGGSASTALDQAVSNSIADGVTYAIAAGNGNFFGVPKDACQTSPARVAAAITVSATDDTDKRASFANFGTCVDLFAPGVDITSAWSTNDTATNTISGTSMATPHVVGAVALYLETDPTATPAEVATAINSNATPGVVLDPKTGSPNRLLYTGSEAPPIVITLDATGSTTVFGQHKVRLDWSGATSPTVDVFMNGALVLTTANDGTQSGSLGSRRGTFTFKVCEAGTATCSNEDSVTF